MVIIVVLLFSTAAELGTVLVVSSVVDGGFNPAGGITSTSLLALFAIGTIYAALTYFRHYGVCWLGERVVADIRKDFFAHILRHGPDFFETTKTADVLSRLVTDTSLLQSLLVATAPSGLHSLILLLGSATLMIATSGKLALIILGTVPVMLIPVMLISRRLRHLSRRVQENLAEIGASANESIRSISTVKAFSHEDLDAARVSEGVETAFIAARRRFRTEALLATVVVVLILVLIVAALWIGAADVAAGRITAGELTAFVIYALLAASALGHLSGFWAQLQRAAGAMNRICEMMSIEPTVTTFADPVALPAPTRGAISFRNVTFSYPSRPEAPALKNFSLEIAPGETVALVGPSGAGKSTVLNLLLRFYDPQEGQVLLDGTDIALVHTSELRRRIGYVAQDPALFSTTVAENIRYGRPDATDDQVEKAADDAAATEFIRDFPAGFNAHLGEEGVRLSGGQRQRLAIARAMLRESAGVLLFDEATSALDSQSERRIQDALKQAAESKTAIVIAHRLATVQLADRIVVLDHGKIVASGTHSGLMCENELYARLARLQFEVTDDPLGTSRKESAFGPETIAVEVGTDNR
ncbi:MAG: ABC transporter transmembrane domain-containing protein [Actinomycetota bacterium]